MPAKTLSRAEAIAQITAHVPALDDERVATVGEIVEQMAQPAKVRALTADKMALIAQSKDDFKSGRTYSTNVFGQ
jgi:hypothetical protein